MQIDFYFVAAGCLLMNLCFVNALRFFRFVKFLCFVCTYIIICKHACRYVFNSVQVIALLLYVYVVCKLNLHVCGWGPEFRLFVNAELRLFVSARKRCSVLREMCMWCMKFLSNYGYGVVEEKRQARAQTGKGAKSLQNICRQH